MNQKLDEFAATFEKEFPVEATNAGYAILTPRQGSKIYSISYAPGTYEVEVETVKYQKKPLSGYRFVRFNLMHARFQTTSSVQYKIGGQVQFTRND
jgi:hypothetical protein